MVALPPRPWPVHCGHTSFLQPLPHHCAHLGCRLLVTQRLQPILQTFLYCGSSCYDVIVSYAKYLCIRVLVREEQAEMVWL